MWKKKEDRLDFQEASVVLQDALILSLDNITNALVVDSWASFNQEKELEANVACIVLKDAFIFSFDNITNVIELWLYFMLHPKGNIFKTMLNLVILDESIWVMMEHVKFLEREMWW